MAVPGLLHYEFNATITFGSFGETILKMRVIFQDKPEGVVIHGFEMFEPREKEWVPVTDLCPSYRVEANMEVDLVDYIDCWSTSDLQRVA